MTAYVPKFETQRDDGAPTPWTNCNPASHAMLVDWWTWGQVNISDVDIRRADPNRIPLDQGMNFAGVAAALRALRPELGGLLYSELDGLMTRPLAWRDLLAHLRAGGAAVVCGNYTRPPATVHNSLGWGEHRNENGLLVRRWQPTGTFGHAVCVADLRSDDRLWLGDPLGHGDYTGDRIHVAALWDFIWKAGFADDRVRVVASVGFDSTRPVRPTPNPAVTDLAGQPNAFGTRYPSYVHTHAQALAWVNRRIREYRANQRPLPKL